MDAISDPKVFRSQIFKVLAGPTQEPFYVHAGVLARSEPLRQMTTGSWKEKEEKTIIWSKWSIEVVEKFIEWLYRDDYSCPYPRPAASMEGTAITATKEKQTAKPHLVDRGAEERDYKAIAEPKASEFGIQASKKRKTGSSSFLSLKEIVRSNSLVSPTTSQPEAFELWMGHMLYIPEDLDYFATLSTHVQLYLMGHQYLLDSLKLMALQRFGAVLMSIWILSNEAPIIGNMISLIREVYLGTGPGDNEEEEPLRNLVTTFVASHFSNFKNSGIERLTASREECDREFTTDLVRKLMLRMATLEKGEGKGVPPPVKSTPTKPSPRRRE
ncbi:MAG: hypothetical protein Q9222_001943 [Ikaeria aurantiellina]